MVIYSLTILFDLIACVLHRVHFNYQTPTLDLAKYLSINMSLEIQVKVNFSLLDNCWQWPVIYNSGFTRWR